eukprot:GFUD01010214.1.p1 GENE.GFUD01010214.1~~GFUD01010214.1.p1  ORF type:complete len:192 (-),score=41.11 GFUD01010214.1:30-605(-)
MKSGYFNGIKENVELMKDFYSDWIFRLYFDSSKAEIETLKNLCNLSCAQKSLDLCSSKQVTKFGDLSAVFGMIWRFLPLADSTVDIMVSRDLDSRFSPREAAAVSGWLSSDLPFHIMRDHPAHGTYILGGTWGAKLTNKTRDKYAGMVKKLVQDASGNEWKKGLDQILLSKWVWPEVKIFLSICTGWIVPF